MKGYFSYDEAKASFKAYQKGPEADSARAPIPPVMKGPLVLTDSEASAPPSPAKGRRAATTQGPVPLRAPVKRSRSNSKDPPDALGALRFQLIPGEGKAESGLNRICGEKQ